MIAAGDHICVGISGGVDSVVLLHVLSALRERAMEGERRIPVFSLCALHVNHQLRGEQSDGDESFVRELCASLEIPLTVRQSDVAGMAETAKCGLEEAGRAARHEAYRSCIKEGVTKIALAHQANDQAETFLFHAARGSSVPGLAGMRPVQSFSGAQIIRPLLFAQRKEIEDWAERRSLAWRSDASNEDTRYARNAIRLLVIPYLEEHVNARAVEHLTQAARDLALADDFLRRESGQRGMAHRKGEDPRFLADSLLEEPEILQGRILLDYLQENLGTARDLGREQVGQLRDLLEGVAGRCVDLPSGWTAIREEKGLRLVPSGGSRCENGARGEEATPVPIAGEGVFRWNGWTFACRLRSECADDLAAADIPADRYTKWLDYDKIEGNLLLRSRREGDRIVVCASGGSRKLKELLIDSKIPRGQRDALPLLAGGNEVFWAVGLRLSERAKITASTKRILEIQAKPPGSRTEKKEGCGENE